MQGVKSRKRQRRKAVRAARYKRVSLARANKIGSVGQRDRSRRARVYDICSSAVQPEMLSDVVRDSRRRHFQNIGFISAAVFQLVGEIFVDTCRAADAVSDDNAYPVGTLLGNLIVRVRERLSRRLNAKQGRAVVVLARKLRGRCRDLRADVSVTAVGVDGLNLADTRHAVHRRAPALVGVFTERTHQSQTRDNHSSVIVHIIHPDDPQHTSQAFQ